MYDGGNLMGDTTLSHLPPYLKRNWNPSSFCIYHHVFPRSLLNPHFSFLIFFCLPEIINVKFSTFLPVFFLNYPHSSHNFLKATSPATSNIFLLDCSKVSGLVITLILFPTLSTLKLSRPKNTLILEASMMMLSLSSKSPNSQSLILYLLIKKKPVYKN